MIDRQEMIYQALSFEDECVKVYGCVKHVSFFDGCVQGGAGCSIPDIVRKVNGRLEAIECKSLSWAHLDSTCHKLREQIKNRIKNLPAGSIQRIVIKDIGFEEKEKQEITYMIRKYIDPIYPDIPIDFFLRRSDKNC